MAERSDTATSISSSLQARDRRQNRFLPASKEARGVSVSPAVATGSAGFPAPADHLPQLAAEEQHIILRLTRDGYGEHARRDIAESLRRRIGQRQAIGGVDALLRSLVDPAQQRADLLGGRRAAERRAFAVDDDGAAVGRDQIEQRRPSLEQSAGEIGIARHGADEDGWTSPRMRSLPPRLQAARNSKEIIRANNSQARAGAYRGNSAFDHGRRRAQKPAADDDRQGHGGAHAILA